MGRNKQAEKKQLLIRVPEELWLETILLNPSLQDETQYLRYGAISSHFCNLMRRDNEAIKDRLRRAAQVNGGVGHASS